jgi:hypothetical protein
MLNNVSSKSAEFFSVPNCNTSPYTENVFPAKQIFNLTMHNVRRSRIGGKGYHLIDPELAQHYRAKA